MTTVLNEMICGTIDSTLNNINLNGDMKVSKEGILSSVSGGSIYDTTNPSDPKKYVGSYNIMVDVMDSDKRSISINVSDINLLVKASAAINGMIVDIETKYKPKA